MTSSVKFCILTCILLQTVLFVTAAIDWNQRSNNEFRNVRDEKNSRRGHHGRPHKHKHEGEHKDLVHEQEEQPTEETPMKRNEDSADEDQMTEVPEHDRYHGDHVRRRERLKKYKNWLQAKKNRVKTLKTELTALHKNNTTKEHLKMKSSSVASDEKPAFADIRTVLDDGNVLMKEGYTFDRYDRRGQVNKQGLQANKNHHDEMNGNQNTARSTASQISSEETESSYRDESKTTEQPLDLNFKKETESPVLESNESPYRESKHEVTNTESPYMEASNEVPSTEASNEVPSTEASNEVSSTEASNEVPSTGASNEVPSTEASNEVPSAEASNEVPSAETSNEVPSTEASNEILSTEASNETPFTEHYTFASTTESSNRGSSEEVGSTSTHHTHTSSEEYTYRSRETESSERVSSSQEDNVASTTEGLRSSHKLTSFDEQPKFKFSDILSKFKKYKEELKRLISNVFPSCPDIHAWKLTKTWARMFKNAWPNFKEMRHLSMNYGEDLRLQLVLCLDQLIHKKYAPKIAAVRIFNLEESEENQKVKRHLQDQEAFLTKFNSEMIVPLVNMFAKMPEMIENANSE